jgi:hypothetical protein
MDHPGRLITCIIAVILITLFSLPYIAQSENDNIDYMVEDSSQKLSESIRNKGYLDKSMYEEYVKFLDASGELYKVEIEDIRPVSGEEDGEMADSGRIATKTAMANLSCHKDHIKNLQGDIPKQEFSLSSNSTRPELFNSLKTIENKASANSIFNIMNTTEDRIYSFSTHVHTDACYAGHRHAESGCAITGGYYTGAMPSTYTTSSYSTSTYPRYNDDYIAQLHCANCRNSLASAMLSDYGIGVYTGVNTHIIFYQYHMDNNGNIISTTQKYIEKYFVVWGTHDSSWTYMGTVDGIPTYYKPNPD